MIKKKIFECSMGRRSGIGGKGRGGEWEGGGERFKKEHQREKTHRMVKTLRKLDYVERMVSTTSFNIFPFPGVPVDLEIFFFFCILTRVRFPFF